MIGMIEKKITLDLEKIGVQERIPVRQGDSLVYRVSISLTKGGVRFFPDGVHLAQLVAILPNGSTVSADCEVKDGFCTVIPGAGFFLHGGPVLCRLVLRGEDGAELYSPAFAFDAESTFNGGCVTEGETYSRIAELLFEVERIKQECEAIASGMAVIGTVKGSVASRDHLVVYNLAEDRYERIPWTSFRTAIKNHLDGTIVSNGITDLEGTGFIATVPELEDDEYLVVGSQLKAVLDRLSALEAKADQA